MLTYLKTHTLLPFLLLCFFVKNANGQYCIPTGDCGQGDEFNLFEIANFSNSSTCNFSSGYTNFTDLPGLILGQGVSYNATFTVDYHSQRISAWADFNNNEVFEAEEILISDFFTGSLLTANTLLSIPEGTPLGDYRLRIQTGYGVNTSTAASSCSVGNFYGETEDYQMTVTLPDDCLQLAGVDLTSGAENSAVLSVVYPSAGTFDIEYVEVGNAPTGIPSDGFDNVSQPVNIESLNCNTNYEFYIRRNCDAGEATDWLGPYAFSTLGTNYCIPTSNCSAGDAFLNFSVNGFSNTSECEDGGYSDFKDLLGLKLAAGTTYEAFFTTNYESQLISVWADFNNNEVFEAEELLLEDIPTVGTQAVVNLTIPADVEICNYPFRIQTRYNIVAANSCLQDGYGETEDYLLTVLPEDPCSPISGVDIQTVTDNSAIVSWNNLDVFADIEIITADTDPTGEPTLNYENVGNNITLTNLESETSYKIYVRKNCSEFTSAWVGPYLINTRCPAFQTPFLENFSVSVGISTPPQYCWSRMYSNTLDGELSISTGEETSGWQYGDFPNGLETFAKSMRFNGAAGYEYSWVVSPLIELEADESYQVAFDFAAATWSSQTIVNLSEGDELNILLSIDYGETWNLVGGLYDEESGTPRVLSFDISEYAGNTISIAFASLRESALAVQYVDNVKVFKGAFCGEVISQETSILNSYSVELDIMYEGESNNWDVDLDYVNYVSTDETPVFYDDVTFPLLIDNLSPGETYEVRVRADCMEDNTTAISPWSYEHSFTMPCDIYFPYYQDFTTFVNVTKPGCWNVATEGDINSGPDNFGGFGTIFGGVHGETNPNRAFRIPTFHNYETWLLSPLFDVSQVTGLQVEFDLALTEYDSFDQGTFKEADDFYFVATTDEWATFSIINHWQQGNEMSNDYDHFVFDLSEFEGGSLQLAFHFDGGQMASTGGINEIYGDNFELNAMNLALAIENVFPTDLTCHDAQDGMIFLEMTGGIPPYSYTWSNGETTQSLEDLAVGEYICTVLDSNEEQFITTAIMINEPDPIIDNAEIVSVSSESAQNGSIGIEPQGGITPYTFNWSTGATSEDLSNLSAGEYCLTITDTNLCEQEFCYTIDIVNGNNNVEKLKEISIHPNPTSENFTINLTLFEYSTFEVKVMDILGRNLLAPVHYSTDSFQKIINTDGFPLGVFYLEIAFEDGESFMYKLIKV